MTTTAELVRGNAAQLAAYRSVLEAIIAEPTASGYDGGTGRRRAEPPLPGNSAAFGALMVIWEAVFRIEEFLRDEDAGPWVGYDLTAYPRQRRGGSAGNFAAAIDAIPKLAAGRDEDMEAWAARALERLADIARAHPDIDEGEKWRPLPSRACPYCGCWFLKVLLGATGQPDGRVECFGHREDGAPCRASWPGLIAAGADLDAA